MIHKGTYDGTIYHNPANRFCIISVKTADKEVPLEARSTRRYRDHLIRFVATGYELPRTDAVELELDGEWKQGKYGMQFQVEQWRQIVPRTKSGVEGYLASGLMVNLAFPAFCRILCNNLLCPECQRFDDALISAEEIIKNINRKFVLVFGDNHFITALPEVIGCSMYGALQGLNSFLFLFRTPGVVPGLILKNQEKAPCDSFPGADLLHKAQIVFLHQTALLIFLLSHLPAYCVQMTVDVRPTGQHLDLQLDGRDFQIRHKRVDDIALLSCAAEHKVDGNHLDHLDIPMVFGVDDAVLDLFDGKIQLLCPRRLPVPALLPPKRRQKRVGSTGRQEDRP